MGLCPHGVDKKHKGCDRCEEVAAAENRVRDRDREERASSQRHRRRFDVDESQHSQEESSEESYHDVDKYNLDKEWEQHPRRFYREAEKLANARRDQALAETELKIVTAELDKEIRDDPQSYGLAKTTEGAIENVIYLQPRWKKAKRAVIEAAHAVDILKASCDALMEKRRALENEVLLHGQQYFCRPMIPEKGKGRKRE